MPSSTAMMFEKIFNPIRHENKISPLQLGLKRQADGDSLSLPSILQDFKSNPTALKEKPEADFDLIDLREAVETLKNAPPLLLKIIVEKKNRAEQNCEREIKIEERMSKAIGTKPTIEFSGDPLLKTLKEEQQSSKPNTPTRSTSTQDATPTNRSSGMKN